MDLPVMLKVGILPCHFSLFSITCSSPLRQQSPFTLNISCSFPTQNHFFVLLPTLNVLSFYLYINVHSWPSAVNKRFTSNDLLFTSLLWLTLVSHSLSSAILLCVMTNTYKPISLSCF